MSRGGESKTGKASRRRYKQQNGHVGFSDPQRIEEQQQWWNTNGPTDSPRFGACEQQSGRRFSVPLCERTETLCCVTPPPVVSSRFSEARNPRAHRSTYPRRRRLGAVPVHQKYPRPRCASLTRLTSPLSSFLHNFTEACTTLSTKHTANFRMRAAGRSP